MTLADKRVLYISYNGMLDPLGQSQVIPYLKELSKLGVRFWLLSYERAPAFAPHGVARRQILKKELSDHGIEWHILRYHQKPSLPATAYDVAVGMRVANRLVRQNKIEMVHARAHIPAVIARAMKRRFGLKIIFDIRGLMAEEYIDADHWTVGSIAARVTKAMEARVLRSTDGVVTLTDALWKFMQGWPSLSGRAVVHQTIPCCIDLEKFRFDETQRSARREELGIVDRFVLVYSGSVGGWYNTDEMSEFFAEFRHKRSDAFFLWLTQGAPAIVQDAMNKHSIGVSDYAIRNIAPANVPSYLSAGDAGIAFYRPGISRLGTSPVKVSEYVACSLPVIMNSSIGDSDGIIDTARIGAIVHRFEKSEYEKASSTITALTSDRQETQNRTRLVAEQMFDLRKSGIEGYRALYESLLDAAG